MTIVKVLYGAAVGCVIDAVIFHSPVCLALCVILAVTAELMRQLYMDVPA